MDHPQDEKSGARAFVEDFIQDQDPKAAMKKWADEATRLVQKHPWIAVAGAVAIGYWLGSRNSNSARKDQPE